MVTKSVHFRRRPEPFLLILSVLFQYICYSPRTTNNYFLFLQCGYRGTHPYQSLNKAEFASSRAKGYRIVYHGCACVHLASCGQQSIIRLRAGRWQSPGLRQEPLTGGEVTWKPVGTSWVNCGLRVIFLPMYPPITFWVHLDCDLNMCPACTH